MIDQSILQLMSLQFHSSPSQIPIVNSSVRISLHSAEWKTNGNPVISMDTVQGSKSQLSISSVSFHYSRDLFEETVHSLLSSDSPSLFSPTPMGVFPSGEISSLGTNPAHFHFLSSLPYKLAIRE